MENKTKLVGKSFEELSVEEMMELQGAADIEPRSAIVVISTIEVSEAISVLVSTISAATVSIANSKKKCK
ncbi:MULTISPECIES: lichenicidin A2 family type 2 lantibiotic [Robinsoniella]|uniref:lichenicidin A2 family type 2 lantibiotic n=1 Tax=Robinsoniella TaxID=588605 RepID=UPI0005C7E077|nr:MULTISPECIES: lichenicidin A2 family type 2 lantibiotic [Robinsoniella]